MILLLTILPLGVLSMVTNQTISGPRAFATSTKLRILIVDDHQLYRKGLKDLLELDESVQVCGQAGNIADALLMFDELQPDLVTVDISLANGNGLELIQRLKLANPRVLILVVTMHEEGLYAERAIAAGASGFICKQAENGQFLEAIQDLRQGELHVSPQLKQKLRNRKAKRSGGSDSPEANLSGRELEILGFIGRGLTTQKISSLLSISASTVETYRERLKSKLNLKNSSELNRHAILWILNESK
jgi:DNA-binding NarL/FixJ family response regulator